MYQNTLHIFMYHVSAYFSVTGSYAFALLKSMQGAQLQHAYRVLVGDAKVQRHVAMPLLVAVAARGLLGVQVYGLGLSEEFLQDFMKQTGTQPIIATKFAPLPWRFREQNVVEACK